MESTSGSIAQINVSDGGVPKLPVEHAEVNEQGIVGDRQRDTRHHGGPQRALCLFAIENITSMRAEGHPIDAGSAGENITTRGLDWTTIVPGAVLRLGNDVRIEITSYTSPCKNLEPFFTDGDFNRLNVKRFPANSRTYAKVLQGGVIRSGDRIELLEPGA